MGQKAFALQSMAAAVAVAVAVAVAAGAAAGGDAVVRAAAVRVPSLWSRCQGAGALGGRADPRPCRCAAEHPGAAMRMGTMMTTMTTMIVCTLGRVCWLLHGDLLCDGCLAAPCPRECLAVWRRGRAGGLKRRVRTHASAWHLCRTRGCDWVGTHAAAAAAAAAVVVVVVVVAAAAAAAVVVAACTLVLPNCCLSFLPWLCLVDKQFVLIEAEQRVFSSRL